MPDSQGLKRAILICRQPKGSVNEHGVGGIRTVLYWLNDAQAEYYDSLRRQLLLDGESKPEQVEHHLDSVILALLRGLRPLPSHDAVFHEMRLRFPTLSDEELAQLPVCGAPSGWISSFNLQLTYGQSGAVRVLRFDMTPLQARAYNDAISAIQDSNQCDRDEAWFTTNAIVGSLLTTGSLTATGDTDILDPLVAAFPRLEKHRLLGLPDSTDEDVRRWSYRDPTRLHADDCANWQGSPCSCGLEA